IERELPLDLPEVPLAAREVPQSEILTVSIDREGGSIPNTTSDHSRIVQIFRYSDLNDDVARGYDFGSAVYPRDGLVYEQEHPDLFIKTPS
ncbi:MAG: hypothetical protein AAF213_13715, partial [Pseudomonadota bacterium]